jgi:phospholipid/cholesterol/gamma-HCH transport system substrate-binding protein
VIPMVTRRVKFAVGLFISGGIFLAVLALILLGATQLYKKGHLYVTYFDESVQGLTQDAPVKYRGVPIGRVERIQVAPDSELVEVILKIESGQILGDGIVAQLAPVGITGSVFIGLDQKKEWEPDRSPPITFQTQYPVVSSKPSEISTLLSGVDAVIKQLRSLDFEGIPEKVGLTLDTLTSAVKAADIESLSGDLRHILEREKWDRIMDSMDSASTSLKEAMEKADRIVSKGDRILGRMDGVLAENEKSLSAILAGFQKTMEEANLVAGKGKEFFSRTDERVGQIHRHLIGMGKSMEQAGENLNQLLDILSAQPSLLLFGRPPSEKELEPDGFVR